MVPFLWRDWCRLYDIFNFASWQAPMALTFAAQFGNFLIFSLFIERHFMFQKTARTLNANKCKNVLRSPSGMAVNFWTYLKDLRNLKNTRILACLEYTMICAFDTSKKLYALAKLLSLWTLKDLLFLCRSFLWNCRWNFADIIFSD